MSIFSFTDIIDEFSAPCALVAYPAIKSYSGGNPVRGDPVTTDIVGAVIPMTKRKVYESGGIYTEADRDFYIRKDKDSISLDDGQTYYIVHNYGKYKVESAGLFGEDYSDFNMYSLRRVDSFDA